jgi:hypothetical protein
MFVRRLRLYAAPAAHFAATAWGYESPFVIFKHPALKIMNRL